MLVIYSRVPGQYYHVILFKKYTHTLVVVVVEVKVSKQYTEYSYMYNKLYNTQ